MARAKIVARDLIATALREGYQLSEDALTCLEQSLTPLEDLRKAIDHIRKKNLDVIVIEAGHILEVSSQKPDAIPPPQPEVETPPHIHRFSIENLVADDARIEGTLEEFQRYFHSRYIRLRRLLERRGVGFIPVAEAARLKDGEEAYMAVMVMNRVETSKSVMLECDDLTGDITVVAPFRDEELVRNISSILLDQVVGIRVRRVGQTFILQEVFQPDVESGRNVPRLNMPETYACLISDTHIGSKKFVSETFQTFLDWLNRGRDGVAKRVRYLIIDGDLVDGVGVYPGQEKELDIRDVEEQFRAAAQLLREVPPHIQILYCPGNHEPVRRAIPQPPIQERYRRILSSARTMNFATNPFTAIIEDRRFLVYHGQSLDEIIQSLPDASYSTLEKDVGRVLTTVIKARHLAPIYGENTQILPLQEDHLVIDTLPDLLHTGHIHRVASISYHGVSLVNSGAWQEQTEYQKLLGVEPSIGTAVLVELSSMNTFIRFFG
ncbi:hypothetical protein HRbin01_01431 [archaeon HR01]|nr:hypothetical protein HRbin01_01431 [archaeon HR01]